MTAYLTHHDERIYGDPWTFRPERWLQGDVRLERYLVPFNRGPRACIGLNLARAELYMILATVFREFDLDVSMVERKRDVDVKHDYILAAQGDESPGILVRVDRLEDG